VSLQQQQQQQRQDQRPAEKKPLYHYKEGINASEKPAWAKEVGVSEECVSCVQFDSYPALCWVLGGSSHRYVGTCQQGAWAALVASVFA